MRLVGSLRRARRALARAALALGFALALSCLAAAPAAAAEAGAPKVGEKAPAFAIQGFQLAEARGKKNILLVFYRGHF